MNRLWSDLQFIILISLATPLIITGYLISTIAMLLTNVGVVLVNESLKHRIK